MRAQVSLALGAFSQAPAEILPRKACQPVTWVNTQKKRPSSREVTFVLHCSGAAGTDLLIFQPLPIPGRSVGPEPSSVHTFLCCSPRESGQESCACQVGVAHHCAFVIQVVRCTDAWREREKPSDFSELQALISGWVPRNVRGRKCRTPPPTAGAARPLQHQQAFPTSEELLRIKEGASILSSLARVAGAGNSGSTPCAMQNKGPPAECRPVRKVGTRILSIWRGQWAALVGAA